MIFRNGAFELRPVEQAWKPVGPALHHRRKASHACIVVLAQLDLARRRASGVEFGDGTGEARAVA